MIILCPACYKTVDDDRDFERHLVANDDCRIAVEIGAATFGDDDA